MTSLPFGRTAEAAAVFFLAGVFLAGDSALVSVMFAIRFDCRQIRSDDDARRRHVTPALLDLLF
jgi:hypothetical protein